MAQAPVVIPGALVQLASGVVLDATLTTNQTVFTAPNGLRTNPQFVVFHDVTAAMNAATTLSVGNAVATTTYYNASAALQSMLTTTGAIQLPLYGSSVGTAVKRMNSGDAFTVTFGGTQTSNGKIQCDVLGYVELT